MPMSPTASSLLLTAVLLVVGLAVALLFSTVFLPQASPAVLMVLAAAAFLGLQLIIFRALGLRSPADGSQEGPGRVEPESAAGVTAPRPATGDEPRDPADDADWRAWRG